MAHPGKQSGIGREGGAHSLEFYTELRNICVAT
jgi:aminomuconate-semialdehyde/2-hydroxymuconate-6-semialdehyde dehydrogenase